MMIFPNKKKKKSKTKKTHNINIGTLYDVNKDLVEKNVSTLTTEEIQNKKDMIIDFINNTGNAYYMLLCNERKDYTIFHRKYDNTIEQFCDNAGVLEETLEKILLDECLPNRGNTKSIELTENKDAVEIWISIDGESYCYYFFPYDAAIIEC